MRILFSARPAVLERSSPASRNVLPGKSVLDSADTIYSQDKVYFSGGKPTASPQPELALLDRASPLEIWGVKGNVVHPEEKRWLPELALADKVAARIREAAPPKVLAALRNAGFKVVLNGGYYSDIYPPKPGSPEAKAAEAYQQLRAIAAAQRLIVVYGKDPDKVLSMPEEDLLRELDAYTDQRVNQDLNRQYPQAQLSQGAYLVQFDSMGIPILKPNIKKLIGDWDIEDLLTDDLTARRAYNVIRDAISQRLTGRVAGVVLEQWAQYGGNTPKSQCFVLPSDAKGGGNRLIINGSADFIRPSNIEGFLVNSQNHSYPDLGNINFPFMLNMGLNGLFGKNESYPSGLSPDSEMGSRIFSNSKDFLDAYDWDYLRFQNNTHKPPRDLTQCQTRMQLFSDILTHCFNPEDSDSDVTKRYPATCRLVKGKLKDLDLLEP